MDKSTIKTYLKAIAEYEKHNKCELLIIDYFKDKRSNLPKLYCEGEVKLPSFLLLKKLHSIYQDHCRNDNELNKLFESGIYYSKMFYSKLITLVIEARNFNINYEKEFERRIQPLGRHLVNLITNIKYRLKIVESEILKSSRQQTNPELLNTWIQLLKKNHKMFFYLYKACLFQFTAIIYQITLLHSTYPSIAKKLYYLLISVLITFFWGINFFTLNNKITPIALAFINIIIGIIIVLLAIMTYPVGNFGKVDIYGKNIVAYNYRAFFNNHSKSKILNIYTLSNVDDPRQASSTEVESDRIL